MSSGPAPPAPPPIEPRSRQERDEYETYIEQRLSRTQRQVKVVDIAAGLLALATGSLVYLLIAALLDHWLIAGGLGFAGRMLLLLGLLLGGGAYFVSQLLPLVIRRINPVFAAHTIERHRPSLKNGLVNLLFLRRERETLGRDQLSLRIYRGMEEKAATELADPSVEAAVDRSGIIRLGYLLAGVLAVCALYLAMSPKSPLVSFRRVMLPWADIQAPTRVTIAKVEPGDAVAFQGDPLTVSAEVRGVEPDEPVSLYFTTADGQSVDQAIPMTVPKGQYRYQCQLPPGSLGLQQNLEYHIAAGDAKSKPFKVTVEIPLTILVHQVHYDYPEYTGIPDRTAPSGDLRAIEGTKVTIEATASRPIQRAVVERDCNPRDLVPMTANGTKATVQLTLRMDPDDPAVPELSSYQIRFRDADGRDNPRPVRHQIDVIADLPPDVRLVDPPEDKIELPVHGALELKIRAEDPDFALRRIALRAQRDDKRSLAIEPLLDLRRPEQPHNGPYDAAYRFEPSKLKLNPGDKITYWAEAEDNKEPIGNHAETPHRTLVIVAPASGDERPQAGPDQERPQEGQDPKALQGEQPQQPPGDRAGDQPMQEQAREQQKPQEGQEKQPSQQQDSSRSQEQQEGNPQGGAGQGGGDSQKQEAGKQQDATKQEGQQQSGAEKSQQPQEGQQAQGQGQQGDGQKGNPQQGKGQESAESKQQGSGQESGESKQQGKSPTAGRSSDDSQEPVDGETNPGEAIERILKHRQEQNPQPPGAQAPSEQPSDRPSPPQTGEQQSGQQSAPSQQAGKPGEPQSPDQKGNGQPQRPPQSADQPQSGG
ncbi:MAG: hypothetical protein HUU20_00290, partial [Pirellulales bacterium]|nr:hypothetical protein [Pirellulales bacterium]